MSSIRPTTPSFSAGTWRLPVMTTCLLAMFCLFSFGTAKLRASIHQERRQALVTTDSGERLAPAAPILALPLPLPGGIAPLAEGQLIRVGWLQPVRVRRLQTPQSPTPRPLRGPPAGR